MSTTEVFKLADYRPRTGASLRGVRAMQLGTTGEATTQLVAVLTAIAETGASGYLLGQSGDPALGFEHDAILALIRFGHVERREEEQAEDQPLGCAGTRLTRWRYYVTEAGKAKLAGRELSRPEPVLDSENTTPAMLAKRAELAERR